VKNNGPVKMADIARLAKVSMSTVSRSLADSPLIPEEKRREIQEIARQAGYVVNQSARSLRLRKTQTIAVVFPLGHEVGQLISDPFFIDMFGRLADEITARGYQVLLSRVTQTNEGWLDRIIQSQRQDGIIIVGQSDQEKAIDSAASYYEPLVVWGRNFFGQTYNCVGTDNVQGAKRAVDHLISLGRRSIAFLGMPELPEINLRYQGYLQAHEEANLKPDTALKVHAHFSYEMAKEAAMGLIQQGTKFDAIFAASDVIALAAIQALVQSGIKVPQEVSVVGFDDIMTASQSIPALTTVRQDLASAAREIVDILFKRISGQETQSIVLNPSLIIRQSCGANAALN
jgi:DNA-binding LacI/PurR family transcriptional regulator